MGQHESWHWTYGSLARMLRRMSTVQTPPSSQLTELVAAVRSAVGADAGWALTAQLVADALRGTLPTPDVLTPGQRRGLADSCAGHRLHVEPDGSSPISGLVWRPGQVTRIHGQMTWC